MDNLLRSHIKLRQKSDSVRFQLVSTELDLAITFCMVAATTSDQGRSDRNIANAAQAYASAAAYYLGNLNCAQNPEIREKLTRLESLLTGFGRGTTSANIIPLI